MDIKTDLHTHTLVSQHAYSTVIENVKYAAENGVEAIAVTDHAPGTPDGAHDWHFGCLTDFIPETVYGVRVFKGAELTFQNTNGDIDLPESILKKLDIVIASIHSVAFNTKTSDEYTTVLLRAIENPYIDIMGHIDRVKSGADYDLVAKEAAKHNKIIELNEHSFNNDSGAENAARALELMTACKKYGTMISVDSDAHFCTLIGNYPHAKELLEKISFDEKNIVNRSLDSVNKYLSSRKR